MLGWKTLTLSSKLACIFLLVLLAAGGVISVAQTASVGDRVTLLGGLLCALAIVSNPASFRPRAYLATKFTHLPRSCRFLMVAGLVGLGLGLVARLGGFFVAG